MVDEQFGTTDVFILLPVEQVSRRYSRRFGVPKNALNDEERSASLTPRVLPKG